MKTLHQFPYFEIQFTKTGQVFLQKEVDDLIKSIQPGNPTDLFVISHGWNNDMDDARRLYDNFFGRLREVLDSGAVPGAAARRYAILAILWPSKKFAEKEVIPSGAAGTRSAIAAADLQKQLDELEGVFDSPKADAALRKARKLVPKLENSRTARKQFGELLRSVLPAKLKDDADGSREFAKLSGDEMVDRLSKPVPITTPRKPVGRGGATRIGTPAPGATAGSAAGLGEFFSGIMSGARNLLNLTTYYQMKERAGTIGSDSVNRLLRKIRGLQPDIRLHLIGHSFGGRLVSAAAVGLAKQPGVGVNTMTLLQAAFSHYGFAQDYEPSKHGFFRRMIEDKMVSGPVLITCTPNDRAVGVVYPLASLMAGQVAAALGDKASKYGGIGRNGAQKTPEAIDGSLGNVGSAYKFQPGKVYNLNADAFITGHSDICKNEVAYAIFKAVVTT